MRRSLFCSAALALMLAGGGPALTSAAGGPCSPKTPQYCPPPKVKTGKATGVTATSATLTGTVNPNGSATTCSFQYGRTMVYGSATPTQHVGSGSKTVNVSAPVTGLTPSTTYHFQLVCKNLGGQARGGDGKFKTAGAPTVTTGRATHRTRSSLTLSGTVNPHGSATRCSFHYGRSQRYGSRTKVRNVGSGTATETVTARVGGLKPQTAYHFRLYCANAAGTTSGGDRRAQTRPRG